MTNILNNIKQLKINKTKQNKRKWFSGKIQRCHRWAPGSIPGLRIFLQLFFFKIVIFEQ